GRHRRFRKVHATLFIKTLARNWWLSPSLHGVEFFASREIRDTPRKTASPAHPHHIFSLARRRFCGPLRTPNHAFATRRLPRARRPVHLHRLRPRRRSWLSSPLAAQSLPLRACP